MQLDAKQKVGVAIYAEYQKDRPDFTANVTPQALQLAPDIFDNAVKKLLNEHLLGGKYQPGAGLSPDNLPTTEGIAYVEKMYGIEALWSNMHKLECIEGFASEYRQTEIVAFIHRVLIDQDERYRDFF